MKAKLSHMSAAILLGLIPMGADADFLHCTGNGDFNYNIADKVDQGTPDNLGCTILFPLYGQKNDSPQPGFVNNEQFFSISDWLFDGKWDSTENGWVDNSSLFNFTGNGQSGTFTYNTSHGLGTLSEIMMIFKDGNDTNLVGYLVSAADGTYSSPFIEPPFNFPGQGPKAISHISVYYRSSSSSSTSGGGEVPEPGVLGLLGLGLLGLALARRRT